MLSREAILGCDDLKREEVQVPEWGGSVFVRVMSGAERDWLDASSLNDQGEAKSVHDRLANYRGRLVVLTTCNEDGSSLFMLPDAEALGKKSAAALDRIVEVAQRINRMTDADVDALTKNSATVLSDDSGSSSRE